jgi:hypothetical protein
MTENKPDDQELTVQALPEWFENWEPALDLATEEDKERWDGDRIFPLFDITVRVGHARTSMYQAAFTVGSGPGRLEWVSPNFTTEAEVREWVKTAIEQHQITIGIE